MMDLQKMDGSFLPPETDGDSAVIIGCAPAAMMTGYQSEILSYTKGRGSLFCIPKGYMPCHDAEAVITGRGYDSEKDLSEPTGSIFCFNGAGVAVSWDQVNRYMHVDSGWRLGTTRKSGGVKENGELPAGAGEDQQLEEIFLRTYGRSKREAERFKRILDPAEMMENPEKLNKLEGQVAAIPKSPEDKEKYLLVDGYNIIFAWEELKELAQVDIGSARDKLIEILSNYQGYKGGTLILVFDAYKVEGGKGSASMYDNIHVIYTKEAETADQYIERAVNKMGRNSDITVATSDHMVQMIVWGEGAMRLSARGLKMEVEAASEEIRKLTSGHG